MADRDSSLRLVARGGASSSLLVLLPGQGEADAEIEIEFPEHVWGRRADSREIERLHHGALGTAPADAPPLSWRREGDAFVCELPLHGGLELTASARLEPDGVRLRYDFVNPTATAFDEVQAVTCVKLRGGFADQRLERAWVHHADGFELLAAETPERLTLPLARWLPCRYLVPFRWPVSSHRVERDGEVMRYHKSRAVDEPFIATPSRDASWIVATCTRETGNVWTNPERSCQHADPSGALAAGGALRLELKVFATRASRERILDAVRRERGA
jgi:hypothetical protein